MKALLLSILSLFIVLASRAGTPVTAFSESGIQAFETTLYPLLRSRCTQCHGDAGPESPHSSSDVTTAYRRARQLINFDDIENSRMMRMIKKRHWLAEDPTVIGMTAVEARTAIQNWWDQGESSVVPEFDFSSHAEAIPSSLPSMADGAFVSISWDLGARVPKLAGCTFSIEIQRAYETAPRFPGSYRVRNPQMACASRTVDIAGLYLSIGDSIEPFENTYASVKTQIAAGAAPSILSSQIMIMISRGVPDLMKVHFSHLTVR